MHCEPDYSQKTISFEKKSSGILHLFTNHFGHHTLFLHCFTEVKELLLQQQKKILHTIVLANKEHWLAFNKLQKSCKICTNCGNVKKHCKVIYFMSVKTKLAHFKKKQMKAEMIEMD